MFLGTVGPVHVTVVALHPNSNNGEAQPPAVQPDPLAAFEAAAQNLVQRFQRGAPAQLNASVGVQLAHRNMPIAPVSSGYTRLRPSRGYSRVRSMLRWDVPAGSCGLHDQL